MRKQVLALVAVLLVPFSGAYAAVDAGFTAAITSVTTDIPTMGTALVGVAALFTAAALAIAYVKKIRSAGK